MCDSTQCPRGQFSLGLSTAAKIRVKNREPVPAYAMADADRDSDLGDDSPVVSTLPSFCTSHLASPAQDGSIEVNHVTKLSGYIKKNCKYKLKSFMYLEFVFDCRFVLVMMVFFEYTW